MAKQVNGNGAHKNGVVAQIQDVRPMLVTSATAELERIRHELAPAAE
jgi:hypothetical protein